MASSHGRVRTTVPAGKPEVRIFLSYSHLDHAALAKLETHLAQLKREGVTTWYDGGVRAGDPLDTNIARELREADLFIALLSPDYLASRYCWDVEYKRAMGRRARGLMRVVAVLLRPCDWSNTRAANFKLLPRDARPISEWRPADKAYLDVSNGIRSVVEAIRADGTKTPTNGVSVKKSPAKKSPAGPKPPRSLPPKKATRSGVTPKPIQPAPSVRRRKIPKPSARQ